MLQFISLKEKVSLIHCHVVSISRMLIELMKFFSRTSALVRKNGVVLLMLRIEVSILTAGLCHLFCKVALNDEN